ncbi:cation-transporting atpase family protein, partial [Toxoplasma gondii ARI]
MSAYSRRSPERPVDYCLLSSLNDAPASSSSSSSLVSASPPPSLSSVPPGFSASVAFRSLGRRREAGRAAQNSEPSGKRERSRGRTLRCEHGALRAAEEKRRARLSEDETARLNAEENAMDWDVPPPASSADYQAAAEDAPVLTLGSRRGTCAQDGNCLQRVCAWLAHACCGVQPQYQERLLYLDGRTVPQYFPSNAIKNTKYNVFTFLPMVLMQQFKFFFNLFYLAVALAQLLPLLQVGPLFTYLAPLAFVLFVTLAKEAYDDYKRYVRDREMNEQGYKRLTPEGTKDVMAAKIEVGDIIQIEANQRVPADVVFLRTTDKSGSCFIRTDQLDGETDWKLRRAVHCTQRLSSPGDLCRATGWCHVEAPRQDIDEFTGKFVLTRAPSPAPPAPPAPPLASFGADGDCGCESRLEAGELDGDRQTEGEKKNCEEEQLMVSAHGGRTTRDGEQPIVEGLTLDNVLWANTVVASGSVLGLAIYTGKYYRNIAMPGKKLRSFEQARNR